VALFHWMLSCVWCLQAQPAKAEKKRKVYKQLVLPTPEQMQQEDVMNNCGVRTVLSGVMGAGLGAVFGVFMVTMDAAVRPTPWCLTPRFAACKLARFWHLSTGRIAPRP